MGAVACLDVGGTAVKAAFMGADGLCGVRSLPTPAAGPDVAERVLEVLVAAVEQLTAEAGGLDAVGLVVPGLVDERAGVARWSANLGWRDVPLGTLLAERTGLPVALGHDVRAGALAEARSGAGAAYRDVLFLPIGTGIAGALVLDGVVFERDRPTLEIGHVGTGEGALCRCGRRGCLETVASARAIAARYAERTGEAVTAADVADRVAAGEEAARVVWQDAVEALGQAVAWLAAVVAPEVVVIGGGLAQSGALLVEPLRAELERRLGPGPAPMLATAAYGDLAGCVGAGLLARDLLVGHR